MPAARRRHAAADCATLAKRHHAGKANHFCTRLLWLGAAALSLQPSQAETDKAGVADCRCWAAQGQCESNSVFMLPNCAQSCKRQAACEELFKGTTRSSADLENELKASEKRVLELEASAEEQRKLVEAAKGAEEQASKVAEELRKKEAVAKSRAEELEAKVSETEERLGGLTSKLEAQVKELEAKLAQQQQQQCMENSTAASVAKAAVAMPPAPPPAPPFPPQRQLASTAPGEPLPAASAPGSAAQCSQACLLDPSVADRLAKLEAAKISQELAMKDNTAAHDSLKQGFETNAQNMSMRIQMLEELLSSLQKSKQAISAPATAAVVDAPPLPAADKVPPSEPRLQPHRQQQIQEPPTTDDSSGRAGSSRRLLDELSESASALLSRVRPAAATAWASAASAWGRASASAGPSAAKASAWLQEVLSGGSEQLQALMASRGASSNSTAGVSMALPFGLGAGQNVSPPMVAAVAVAFLAALLLLLLLCRRCCGQLSLVLLLPVRLLCLPLRLLHSLLCCCRCCCRARGGAAPARPKQHSKAANGGEDEDKPAIKANMGVQNAMYWDKDTGKWRERGKEHLEQEEVPLAPPPSAGSFSPGMHAANMSAEAPTALDSLMSPPNPYARGGYGAQPRLKPPGAGMPRPPVAQSAFGAARPLTPPPGGLGPEEQSDNISGMF